MVKSTSWHHDTSFLSIPSFHNKINKFDLSSALYNLISTIHTPYGHLTTQSLLQGYHQRHVVILIGNCKVGKTSFLNFMIGKSISQKNLTPTIGVEYAPVNIRVGSNDVRVNIWDTCKLSPNQLEQSSTSRSRGPTTGNVMELSSCLTSLMQRASKTLRCGSKKSNTKSKNRKSQKSSLPISTTLLSPDKSKGLSPKSNLPISAWKITSNSMRLQP